MSLTRHRLIRAGRAERRVIMALRKAAHTSEGGADLAAGAEAALSVLAHEACALGYDIRPAATAYVSDDELKLVGWLALFQRGGADQPMLVDGALIDLLAAAARALSAACQLPYQAMIHAGRAVDEQATVDEAPSGLAGASRFEPVGQPSVRSRAVAFMREHGPASTALLRSRGFSRQYLHALCRQGAVVRLCHGVYGAAPVSPDPALRSVIDQRRP